MVTGQNNRHPLKPGDVVQYTRVFWEFVDWNGERDEWLDTIVDNPMIILVCNTVATRLPCESDMTDKDEIDYYMYDVIQGDKQFEISEAWVELVS